MPPISARRLQPCLINGWTTTRTQLLRVSFWRNANAPRVRRTCFPLAKPATPSRILCPIIFLRIELPRRTKTPANPEFLHATGSFWIAPAPKMATTLRTPTQPKGASSGARPNALPALAAFSIVRASQNCTSPPQPYSIASSRDRTPSQRYVMAALYELWGAIGAGEHSLRAHKNSKSA